MTAPRPRRQAIGIQQNELSPAEKYQMLTGQDFFNACYGRDSIDIDRMRADWQEFRDELLQEWIEHLPGTRPFAWWKFEAPELRRPIDGRPHPFDDPERIAAVNKARLEYPDSPMDTSATLDGVPSLIIGVNDVSRKYESQHDYLTRLNLLFPGESKMTPTGKHFPQFIDSDRD